MTAKTIEIRDRATFIPAIVIRLDPSNEADRYLLARSGYGRTPETQREYVLLAGLAGGLEKVCCDPHDWLDGTRTRSVAHQWVIEHFDEIESGAVVDVEFILGESAKAKVSESTEEYV